MKKMIVFLLVLLFVAGSSFAYAAPVDEISTFGGDSLRQRYTNAEAGNLFATIIGAVGKSYSQPLILDGSRFGVQNPVTVFMAGEYLWAMEIPEVILDEKGQIAGEVYTSPLVFGPLKLYDGSKAPAEPTGSHTTFASTTGLGDILISGTRDGYIYIHDLKGQQKAKIDLQGSDITSAPLFMVWNGHPLIIAGNGDGGDAVIVYNLENNDPQIAKVHIGGRISSSPSPIEDWGFIMGSDGKNVVRAYNFADIFDEANGALVPKSDNPKYVWEYEATSGVPASFAVLDDVVYFSSKDGVMRCLGIEGNNGKPDVRWINSANKGTYINHSPAVDEKYVYFPINNAGGNKGRLVVLEKGSGRTVTTMDFESRLVTSPAVTNLNVIVGTEGGALAMFQKDTWSKNAVPIASSSPPPAKRQFSSGISAEISTIGDVLTVISTVNPADFAENESDAGFNPRIKVNPADKEITGLFAAYRMLKNIPDVYVKSLDTGIPEGQNAEPGKTYTGKVVIGVGPQTQLSGKINPVDVVFGAYDAVPAGAPVGGTNLYQRSGSDGLQYGYPPQYDSAKLLETPGLTAGYANLGVNKPNFEPDGYRYILGPGEEKTFNFAYTAPTTEGAKMVIHAEAGQDIMKHLEEGIDPNTAKHLFLDTDLSNNFKEVVVTVGPAAPVVQEPQEEPVDLVMTSLTAPSSWTTIEKKFTVTARFKNNSQQSVTTAVEITANGDTREYKTVTLGPGKTGTASAEIGGKPDTTYNLKATIDPDNKIKETNEGNNSKTAKTVVGPAENMEVLPPPEGGVRGYD